MIIRTLEMNNDRLFPSRPAIRAAHPMCLRSLASWLTALGLCCSNGCDQPRHIAGGTSETTNGEDIATLTYADGSAAARVRILIVDDEDWTGKVAEGRSVVIDSAYTDADGKVALKPPATPRCNLQIDADSQGGFVRDIRSHLASTLGEKPLNSADSIRLAKAARAFILAPNGSISGRARTDTGAAISEMRLLGTAYTAALNVDGYYTFNAVAPGTYGLVAMVRRNGSVQPVVEDTVVLLPGDTLRNRNVLDTVPRPILTDTLPRTLVDDFEHGFWWNTVLGKSLGEGMWYSKTVGGSGAGLQFFGGREAFADTSLRAVLRVGKTDSSFVSIGFQIGMFSTNTFYDLSKLTAFGFWAKGSGSVDVTFLAKGADTSIASVIPYAYTVALQPTWSKVTIPGDSLQGRPVAAVGPQPAPWAIASSHVIAVEFIAKRPLSIPGDTVTLWMDEMYFEGMRLQDVVPAGP